MVPVMARRTIPKAKENTMQKSDNVCVWFEIPATDLKRAKSFYEAVFPGAMSMVSCDVSGEVIVFDAPEGAVKGAIVKAVPGSNPGAATIVYINGGNDLAVPLSRVEMAGGKVLVGKTALPAPWGFMAQFQDSEGNTVGLHSLA